jgi:uncharacterized repeat protein (TIGR01451 family)
MFFKVTESTKAGTVQNCVYSGGSVPSETLSACKVTVIKTEADVQVTKTRVDSCVVAGEGSSFYTITVRNAGPSRAYNVKLSDTVPSQFTYVGQTVTTNTFGFNPCSFPPAGSVGPTISCVFGEVATTDRYEFVYELRVASSYSNTTDVPNVASVTSSCSTFDQGIGCSGSVDLFPGNDQATVLTDICAFADLEITKSPPAQDPITAAGGSYSFGVTVQNKGPSDSYNVTVTDFGFTGGVITNIQSLTLGPRGLVTCNTATLSCFYPVLKKSDGIDNLIVTFTVPNNQPCGSYPNYASVQSASTRDPNPSNNNAQASANVITRHLLTIDKQGQDVAIGGATGSFWTDVSNAGPSYATQVVFTDLVPSVFHVTSVTTSFSDPNACGFVGQLVTCHFGNLAPNGALIRVTIFYSVNFDEAPEGPVNNTACVQATPTAACEEVAKVCDVFATAVQCVGDLEITKTDNVDTIVAGVPGQTFTFTILITNRAGPSASRVVFAYDNWPIQYSPPGSDAELTPVVSRDGVVAVPSGCYATGISRNFACNLGTINPGKTVQITVVYQVLVIVFIFKIFTNFVLKKASVPAGNYTNYVVVNGTCNDANQTNNYAQDTNQILNRADIGIVKDDCSPNIIAGGAPLVFTFTVTNKGPSNGVNVVLEDFLPSPYTIIGEPNAGTTGAFCSLIDGNGFRCTFPTVAVGVVYNIRLTYYVKSDVLPTTATNCARFLNPLVVEDPILLDNEDCDTNDVCTRADLEITKTVTYGTPNRFCFVLFCFVCLFVCCLFLSNFSFIVIVSLPEICPNRFTPSMWSTRDLPCLATLKCTRHFLWVSLLQASPQSARWMLELLTITLAF